MRKQFFKQLKKYCKVRGNAYRLARRAGVSPAYISMLLSGQRTNIGLDMMEQIWQIIR